jgi:hypothetical protein
MARNERYSAELEPCNIAFINLAKAASYTAAVASALVVVIAHSAGESNFNSVTLTGVLFGCWGLIILTYCSLLYRHNKVYREREEKITALIEYPFKIRDRTDYPFHPQCLTAAALDGIPLKRVLSYYDRRAISNPQRDNPIPLRWVEYVDIYPHMSTDRHVQRSESLDRGEGAVRPAYVEDIDADGQCGHDAIYWVDCLIEALLYRFHA